MLSPLAHCDRSVARKGQDMKIRILSAAALLFAVSASGALAQAPDYMKEDCAKATQSFFQEFEARTDVTYEGQRTDGTHAINGTIYLENRAEDFQCSYAGDGVTMVDFITEGKSWPGFARGTELSPNQAASQSENTAPAASSGNQLAVVKFPAGSSGTMLEGAIRGQEYFDYQLDASSGQTMSVDLRVDGTNGDGTIYFNILPPGSNDVAMFIGSRDGNSATVRLPQSGPYLIRLYLMGNDRDTDKTVGYDLDVSIR